MFANSFDSTQGAHARKLTHTHSHTPRDTHTTNKYCTRTLTHTARTRYAKMIIR